MNLSVTFNVSDCSREQIAGLFASISSMTGGAQLQNESKPAVLVPVDNSKPAEKPARAKRRTKAEIAADKKAAEEAKAVEVNLTETEEESEGDLLGDEPVTIDQIKDAVRAFIERHSMQEAKKIFAELGAKKLPDVPEEKFGELLAKLQA